MYLILFSIFFGYLTAKVFAGPKAHHRGVFKSIILHFRKYKLHLHHWIMGFVIILMIMFFKVALLRMLLSDIDAVIICFFVGIIIQGILDYKDWREVLIKD